MTSGHHRIAVAALGLLCTPALAQQAEPVPGDVVVEGRRVDDRSIVGAVQPLAVLDSAAVQAVGAMSMARLLERLEVLSKSPGGGPPILLLNGRRISGFEELESIPPEAIEKFEVLPEAEATRFGYPPTRRVTNIVTFRRFRAVELNPQANTATDGGGTGTVLRGGVTRLDGSRRLTLGLQGEARDGLLERQRGIVPDPAAPGARSLLPELRKLRVNGGWAAPIDRGTSASLSWSAERLVERSLRGGLAGSDPVRQRSVADAYRAGAGLNGTLGDWTWNATGSAARTVATVRTTGGATADRTRAVTRTLAAKAVANGALLRLPAGDATLSVTADWEDARSRRRALVAAVRTGRVIDRTTSSAAATLSLPLTSRAEGVLPILGDLTIGATGGVGHVAGYGSFPRLGATLGWQPLRLARFGITLDRQQSPPTATQLFDPARTTPDVPVFDYLTGTTVFVAATTGGNPLLAPERQRRTAFDVTLQPFPKRDLRLTLSYTATDIVDQAATLSAPTPLLAAAFPTLFTRDAAGRLVAVDSRPVNLAAERRRELGAELGFGGPLGSTAPPVAGSTTPPQQPIYLFLSLRPVVRLSDQLRLRDGVAGLDLLAGDTISGAGGRPRVEVSGFAAISRNGVSLSAYGQWTAASRVRNPLATADLRFSDLMVIGTYFVLPMERIEKAAWAKRLHLSVEVANILGQRQRVRDRTGATPLGFQPGYLDPLGRTVSVALRKLF